MISIVTQMGTRNFTQMPGLLEEVISYYSCDQFCFSPILGTGGQGVVMNLSTVGEFGTATMECVKECEQELNKIAKS